MSRAVPGLVVMFTDASFQMRTHAAGWGAWAIREGWRGSFEQGPIKTAKTANDAELMAIACAMQRFANLGIFKDMDKLMIKSDCARALQVCCKWAGAKQSAKEWEFDQLPDRASMSDGEARAVSVILKVLGAAGISNFTVRHVKGHVAQGDGSNRVNEMCDRLAKQEQRKMDRERVTQKFVPPGRNARPQWGQGQSAKAKARRRRRETAGAGNG
jgi:ribonuclease HI